MTVENAAELAIAHNVTEEEVIAYQAIAASQPLLVKQACVLRDNGFSRENVRQWLMFKLVNAPIDTGLESSVERCLANL